MESCKEKYYFFNDEVKSTDNFDGSYILAGKSLYEVIRIVDGVPLFLEKHMKRLFNSADISNLKLSFTEEEIKHKLLKLIEVNDIKIGNVKLVFNYIENKTAFYAYFIEYHYPEEEAYKNGVKTIFYHGERTNPNAKIINVDFRKKVDEEIKDKKVYEAILVDRNGNITEGSRSNIFMVKGDKIITSPLKDVLPGVTRDIIISLAEREGYEVLEESIKYYDALKMDGLFISGTSPKVLPISKIDDSDFNSSSNNVIKVIMKLYDIYTEEYIRLFNKI